MKEIIKTGNLFSPVKKSDDEYLEILMSGASSSLRVERIVSQGHKSPSDFWYDQNECEFAAVIQGSAVLEFEDGKLTMNAGDWVIIPEHVRHRVDFTSEEPQCVWLTVFKTY